MVDMVVVVVVSLPLQELPCPAFLKRPQKGQSASQSVPSAFESLSNLTLLSIVAPAKKTPPKERFTAWLLKQKEPDSFEELLDLIDKAPMSESTKDVLLKYLRKVPKSDELASVVISFHGTGETSSCAEHPP